jgi:parallel beta helix pectate lyase-like protein
MEVPIVARRAIFAVFVFALHFSAVAQGNLTPPGAPAATMKSLDQVEARTPVDAAHSPGSGNNVFVITNAGSYYLTGNISVSGANKVGISINSDNVTLDLNGFSVDGNSTSYRGINVALLHQNVVVRNGVVRNWANNGVDLSLASNATAEDLLVSSNANFGISCGENSLIKNCRAFGNGSAAAGPGTGAGIGTSSGTSIIDCQAERNNGSGTFGITTGAACSVINCTAFQNNGFGGGGINAGQGCTIVNCSAELNGGTNSVGIIVGDRSSALHCTATLNGNSVSGSGVGIAAVNDCTISECTAGNNYSDGIQAAGGCLISMNSACANGGSGIHTTGQGNRIDSNNVTFNSGNGIKVDTSGNFVVRNSAHSDGGGSYNIAASNADAQQLTVGTAFATTNAWANFSF